VLTTNRDVSTIPPDLTKRMVTCHIDAAIPENRSVTERIARRAQKEIGTAMYRAYLQRLMPEVSAMRADIDHQKAGHPGPTDNGHAVSLQTTCRGSQQRMPTTAADDAPRRRVPCRRSRADRAHRVGRRRIA
jgi:hypothetical protein